MKWLVNNVHNVVLAVLVIVPVLLGGALLWNDRGAGMQSLADTAIPGDSAAPSAEAQPAEAQPAAAPTRAETAPEAPAGEPAQAQADPHAGVVQHAQASQPAQPEALKVASTAAAGGAQGAQGNAATYVPDVSFTLRTDIAEGKMVFIGVGGEIDGVVNPELHVEPNSVVQITLINGDGAQHDWAVPDLNAKTELISGQGSSSSTVFRVGEDGEYTYL